MDTVYFVDSFDTTPQLQSMDMTGGSYNFRASRRFNASQNTGTDENVDNNARGLYILVH